MNPAFPSAPVLDVATSLRTGTTLRLPQSLIFSRSCPIRHWPGCGSSNSLAARGVSLCPWRPLGTEVLATDLSIDVLSLLAERLTERRVIQLGIADRVEIRQADMVSFDIKESFKAVCLPMASITLLNPEQRGATIRCAAAHMAIGGALIASIDQVLPAAAATSTIRLRPDTYLTEEIDHAGRRRRTILRCRDKEYISEHYLVTPEDLVNDLKEASLFLAAQCSTPDPVRPHHISVILGAVNRR